MKRIGSCLLTIVLILGLCACGQKATASWQEQYDLGVRYLSEGNYEESIIAFTAAIEIDPKRPEAYVGRADAYIRSGETEENITKALKDYQTATDLDETLLEAWLGIADMYLKLGDDDTAIEILKSAIEKVGNPEQLYNRLDTLLSETDSLASDPNVFVYEMGANLYLTEDTYQINRMMGTGIDNFQVYINFSKNAPNEMGYIQFSGTWADGVSRRTTWGHASSLEMAEDSWSEQFSPESNQPATTQFDIGLGLEGIEQAPYVYIIGINGNGSADSGVLLTLNFTPEIQEKIEALKGLVFE